MPPRYVCTARNKGWPSARNCRPAPLIRVRMLDECVEEWFLQRFGDGMIFETVYDPGNGVDERIAEVRATRERLRADREAGLYDAADDAAWFRERYAALGRELSTRSGPSTTAPVTPSPRSAWEGCRRNSRILYLLRFGPAYAAFPHDWP
ncbi:hypothetical protein ACFVFQ_21700 [Streptomyces sp. NPDC057743]|uniref:hypothetical protein n=1 Tax=Streptomyces sp. NPDC057743 TaxID=3346236 RepID=UPI00367F5094